MNYKNKKSQASLLLVEDMPVYGEAAIAFLTPYTPVEKIHGLVREYAFAHRQKTISWARDYRQAMHMIKNNKYDGIITDLFFPEKTGTDRKKLGYSTIEKIVSSKDASFPDASFKDESRRQLNNALGKSESNQPLGVLIWEYAKRKKIPCIMTSSSNHHENIIQPIFNYLNARCVSLPVAIVDCDDKVLDKSSEFIWKSVLTYLSWEHHRLRGSADNMKLDQNNIQR